MPIDPGARSSGIGMVTVADDGNTASQAVARRADSTQDGVLRSYLEDRDGSRGEVALSSRLPGD